MRRTLTIALWVRTAMRLVWAGVGVVLIALLLSIRADVVELPRLAVETRGLLIAEIDRQVAGIRGDAVGQIIALRTTTDARLKFIQSMVDLHAASIERIANSRLSEAQGSIDGLRSDLSPVLAGAARLEASYSGLAMDARDSLDDLYPDVKGIVASATVAVTSTALASEAVRDAAPKLAQSAVGMGDSASAIAADVRREADEITKPKKWWQKALGPIYIVGRLAAAFL